MFKRIQKKQKKTELEEELGLDDDTKQALGLGNVDTDTDESESEPESDSDGQYGDSLRVGTGADTEILEVEEGGEEEDGSDTGGSDIDEQLDGEPPLTLDEALRNPVYSPYPDKDERSCLVCPHKRLKGGKMVDVHLQSGVRHSPSFRNSSL